MIGHARAGVLAEVQADIEPLRSHRFPQELLAMQSEIPQLEDFVFA